jgi:periplasmic mercuric ion binding protein
MKRLALPFLVALVAFLPAIAMELTTEKISLPTVQCGMCKNTIESKLADLEGLSSITVDVEKLTATVVYDSDKLTLKQIENAISKIGYDANETLANMKAQSKLMPCCRPGGDR